MKIIIAPDSFKGSLTAREAATAMEAGVLAVFPEAEIVSLPLADGGEGMVDAMCIAVAGSRRIVCPVIGPLGSMVNAEYALLAPDFTSAVIEMAQAAGLTLVPPALRNPLNTTTYGVGELLVASIAAGARRLIIGLGGSATNDGGAGALQALGVSFLDALDASITAPGLPMTGGDLQRVHQIAFPKPTISDTLSVVIASDVINPLTGPDGASVVFGPQKGATPEMVERLDADLTAYGGVLDEMARMRGRVSGVSKMPGAGAAGGLGAALLALFPQAAVQPGIEVVLEVIDFDSHLQNANLVLTGEGKLDMQTLSGKAIHGVLLASHRRAVPVIAFSGVVDVGAANALRKQGLINAYPLTDLAMSQDDAMENAADYLKKSVRDALTSLRLPVLSPRQRSDPNASSAT